MSAPVHIVCRECDGINRTEFKRLSDNPRCGRCHELLFVGHSLALNESRFMQHLRRNDIPILVDFWAAWCAPCRAMAPVLEQAASSLEPYLRLIKIDTERENNLANYYAIRGIPTLILLHHEREIARISGALDLSQLRAWIQPYLQTLN